MTYSIVAYDPVRKLFGVAVASGSIAVGSRVPWAKAGVGAVATQAYTNPSLGPKILDLLLHGFGAREALLRALDTDPDPSSRQVAVIDSRLEKAFHNGKNIPMYYGGYSGRYSVCIANLVADPNIPETMCSVFDENLEIHGLPVSLIIALKHGSRLGGDRRGDRTAALLVVGLTEYGEFYDKIIDLRIDYDWDEEPVDKLEKLYMLWKTG